MTNKYKVPNMEQKRKSNKMSLFEIHPPQHLALVNTRPLVTSVHLLATHSKSNQKSFPMRLVWVVGPRHRRFPRCQTIITTTLV